METFYWEYQEPILQEFLMLLALYVGVYYPAVAAETKEDGGSDKTD